MPTYKRLGKRPLGRVRGSVAARTHGTRLIAEAAAAKGITPLEYMLKVLRNPDPTRMERESARAFYHRTLDDIHIKLAAARYAAPYIHARIATEIKLNTPLGVSKPIDVRELAKSVAFLLTMPEHRKVIEIPTSH